MDDREIAAVWTSSNNRHTADIATSWTNGPSILGYVPSVHGPSILGYVPSVHHQSTYRQLSFLAKDTVTVPSGTA